MKTVDISNYTRELTPEVLDCWKNHGVEHVVVRLSMEDYHRQSIAKKQISVTQEAGFVVSGYFWGYLVGDPGEEVRQAYEIYKDQNLAMWSLDVEAGEGTSPEENIPWVGGALATLDDLGLKYCLYTAKGFWLDKMGDTEEFSHVPLWTADWDSDPNMFKWKQYGGWEGVVGKQYLGDIQLCDRNVDLNEFDRGWLLGYDVRPEPWPEPEPEPIDRWIEAMLSKKGLPYVFGGKDPDRDGGLDCSGLITWAAGGKLGDPDYTSADALRRYTDPVPDDEVQRGDIVLFHSTYGNGGSDYATHCGVVLEPGVMVDTHGDPWPGVGTTNYLDSPYWSAHYMGAFRPTGMAREDAMRIAELEKQLAAAEEFGNAVNTEVAKWHILLEEAADKTDMDLVKVVAKDMARHLGIAE